MEWSMRLNLTNKVSTGNAETMSAMAKLKDHRDCVREGTAKQRNVKAWKVMNFRSEAQSLPCEVAVGQKSMRSPQHSDWKRLAGDPVSGEDSLRVEQLDYFEQVLENSVVTSEERVDQLTRSGMQSDAMDANNNKIHSQKRKAGHQRSDHLSRAPSTKGFQQASCRGLRRTQRLRET